MYEPVFCTIQGFLGFIGPKTKIFRFFGHFFLHFCKYNPAYTSVHVPLNTKDEKVSRQHAKERISPETKNKKNPKNMDFTP